MLQSKILTGTEKIPFLHSIRFRFFLGFSIFILIFLLILPLVYSTHKSLQHDLDVITKQSGQQRRISEMSFLINQYALTADEKILDALELSSNEFDETLAKLEGQTVEMRTLWAQYKEVLSKTKDLLRSLNQGADVSLEDVSTLREDLIKIGPKLVAANNVIVIDLERKAAERITATLTSTIILLVVSILLAVILIISGGKIIIKPILQMSEEIARISSGDLSSSVEIKPTLLGMEFRDEISQMVRGLNQIIMNFRVSLESIQKTSVEITSISDVIGTSSSAIQTSAQTQSRAAEETSGSINEINTSVKNVAGDAQKLLNSTEGASASFLDMSTSITEVAESSQKLALSVDRAASSISQIVTSLSQVSVHVDTLFTETEEVVTATIEINATIKEVGVHSREQAQLAERVKGNALTLGIETVTKTKDGMEKIREEVSSTAQVINRLGDRSREIGKIIGVIDDIADTTSLLSLNAAILAAQAGEHGKGFAVVADEVKELAKRTAASTKEISRMIKEVQNEAKTSITHMGRSLERVEEGVDLTRNVEDALSKIIESSEASLTMAKMVEGATEEQMKEVEQVTRAIHKVNNMVEEIKRATDEQKKASTEILQLTEEMRDLTIKVQQSTHEQSREGRQISDMISDVVQKMQAVTRAMNEQTASTEKIVKSVDTISKETKDNLSMASKLDKSVSDLDSHAVLLNEKVSNFKL